MKKAGGVPFIEIAILAFCLWQARDLPGAWNHSPYDRLGWLALLLWLAPLAIFRVRKPRHPANAVFLVAAIVLGLLGDLAEFHFPGHLALALALAAWLPFSGRLLVWLATALAWMPVLGWELSHCSPGVIIFIRLILALAGAAVIWPDCRTVNKKI